MSMTFHPLIWVEGIIGAGKTTFSKEVARRLNLWLVEEPVESNPYLELFYKNQKKYAFGMQIHLLHRRYAMQQLASYIAAGTTSFDGAVLDRSLSGDRVFAKLHRDAGNIEEIDWQTYEMAYDVMCRTLLPPTLLIFLDVQPETAYQRIIRRSRSAESGLLKEYLITLRRGYNELLYEAERGLLPWSHAVRVHRFLWDPDTLTEAQWDATADTVRESCKAM